MHAHTQASQTKMPLEAWQKTQVRKISSAGTLALWRKEASLQVRRSSAACGMHTRGRPGEAEELNLDAKSSDFDMLPKKSLKLYC